MTKISQIAKIQNFAVFKNFDWNANLTYKNNKGEDEIYDFKDINIFYGRNYSGKTSLSKIIRALETKTLSIKYENPNFRIELSDSSIISQNNLSAFTHPIHVYNSDFVKENLKFIHDENANIEAFSVTLGGNNQQILDRIQELENELGSNEENTKSGVFLNIQNKEVNVRNAKENHSNKYRDLEKLLTDRATRNSDSIKNQHSLFGDINYNVTKLKNEIIEVQNSSFQILTEAQINVQKALINQNELPDPPELSTYTLDFSQLIELTNEILKTTVGGSQKIEELVNNSILNSWVQTGHQLHKDRRSCAFCTNEITENRQIELRNHFDKETQNLQNRITKSIEHLTSLIDGENFKINIDIDQYYTQYHAELLQLKIDLQSTLDQQKNLLRKL
ncbi:AAA domain-containing protein [Acinetobacter marinus]|uniref:AAA domain-containing protein n=1 Tax=Acinetobacter marinus TaxID=281375 RepID=A0A1G6LI23_9GAMM|nr:AAA family ATPase [Acinetobacter marinus]SDC42824.1 AAA domain-containing protein [Acinetobacter marinus]